jgi:FkbM family methyltransferase
MTKLLIVVAGCLIVSSFASENRDTHNHTLREKMLREFYTKSIDSQIQWNNWNLGCSDLNVLAPYVRLVLDRQSHKQRQVIFDVGANNGQDTLMVMNSFQQVIGMCHSFGHPFKVISVEPSPKVFCELEELVQERGWQRSDILRLNIGLSDKSGILEFSDPGNEGGKLTGSVLVNLPEISAQDLEKMTSCSVPGYKSLAVDQTGKRTTKVSTYTMDGLVKSLELPSIKEISPNDQILMLKIDTEGHDGYVIKGSSNLLTNKRVTFVLFEIGNNKKLKDVVEFMDQHDYLCFIILPTVLIPVHTIDWWYSRLDTFERGYWANGFCGIRNSPSLSLLYNAFHADNDLLLHSHNFVMNRLNRHAQP